MRDGEIVSTIISLATQLHIETIAEGVETEDQRCELVARGGRFGQGYLFSRPLDAVAASDYISRSHAQLAVEMPHRRSHNRLRLDGPMRRPAPTPRPGRLCDQLEPAGILSIDPDPWTWRVRCF